MSLTLRQYAAAKAMAARIGDVTMLGSANQHAKAAVRYADALIAELEATPARADVVAAGAKLIAELEKQVEDYERELKRTRNINQIAYVCLQSCVAELSSYEHCTDGCTCGDGWKHACPEVLAEARRVLGQTPRPMASDTSERSR